MLPDYPHLKTMFYQKIQREMEGMQKERLHVFRNSPRRRLFEGDGSRYERDDGHCESRKFNRAESELVLKNSEAETLTYAGLMKKLYGMTTQIADQQMKHSLEVLDEGIRRVGNVVEHAKGDYVDGYFRSLEQIDIDFDDDDNPHMPEFLAGSEAATGIAAALEAIDNDPELCKRRESIIERKREEWRARESNRKLVR